MMVFTVITLSYLSHVVVIRLEKESLFSIGVFSNMHLTLAVVANGNYLCANIQYYFQNTAIKHG
jgi:Ca2+-transporting ATPase